MSLNGQLGLQDGMETLASQSSMHDCPAMPD